MISPLAPPPELLALLQMRASFVLALHKGPDGDAMGSGLALLHALRAHGKAVQLVAPTEVAAHYRWLPGAELLQQSIQGQPDVTIYLDCDSPERAGDLQAQLEAAPTLVQIDHHKGQAFGHVQYLDRTAAATTVLIYRIMTALQWPITPDIATCLYTGIVTDTGSFRFENTNIEVLSVASQLVALGAVPSQVAERVSESRPISRMRLLGRALAGLQSSADGRIIWSVLGPEDYQLTDTSAGDTEGIIDLLKQVEGQRVSMILKAPESLLEWQISLRSPVVDVAEVARQFGGGGHARAAGCDLSGPLDEVLPRLVGALQIALAQLVEQ
ncbi:MAG: DHH family phosphoesterase [Armatimonadota bacterium]